MQCNLEEIYNLLQVWRDNRNIKIESQFLSCDKMIQEELEEYINATNEHDKIDALCDIMVISINCGVDYKVIRLEDTTIDKNTFFEPGVSRILKSYQHMEGHTLDTLTALYTFCAYKIIIMGYDLNKCLLETIKEISSREQDPEQKQRWDIAKSNNEEINEKWQKNLNQDPSTLYKADYTLAYRGDRV